MKNMSHILTHACIRCRWEIGKIYLYHLIFLCLFAFLSIAHTIFYILLLLLLFLHIIYPIIHRNNSAYGAHCRFLHDPRIEDTSEARPTCRKVQKRASNNKSRVCNPAFVDSHYFDTRNPLIQENPLVQTPLWEMRGGSGDDFVETCNLLANKIDDKSLSVYSSCHSTSKMARRS
jgi:hypothetical protein